MVFFCRGDTLIVWKLDRLGRDLRHLINVVHDLSTRSIGFKVLTGHGASIDTTTSAGKLVFGIFASLAEFERDLISERTKAGLASARARGQKGGAPFKMTAAKVRLAMAAMGQKETKVADLCSELGVTRQTLYRHVAPNGTATQGRFEGRCGWQDSKSAQKEAVKQRKTPMRKIIILSFLTLDGVMQAPGGPNEERGRYPGSRRARY